MSIIGPGMAVVGDCKAGGAIHIEGNVEGNVKGGAAVVIGENAVVRGSVWAEDAVVSGRVEGNLTISSRLKLRASSGVEGDIDAQVIEIERGAVINGTIEMGSKPQ